jgi:Mg/Co/Ni transporter MgtE
LRQLLDEVPVAAPEITDRDVAVQLASYDLLAIPVCDRAGRLLGAVTVDDVIDRMLGTDWRKRQRRAPDAESTSTSGAR